MLRPLLFFIYINNIDDNLRGIISMFSAGTKIVRVVTIEDESPMLMDYIAGLVQWNDKWQMVCKPDACEVMQFGRNNNTSEYLMNSWTLGSSEEHVDLGYL